MEKKKLAKISLAILLCVIFSVQTAKAELITIKLTGNVYLINDPQSVLGGQIHYNDMITGTYTYDTSTPDSSPESGLGRYWHYNSSSGVSFTINGFNFRTDPDNVQFLMGVSNNSQEDAYWFCSYNNLPLTNGALVSTIDWQITDSSGSALSSDALPTTAPNLANFDMDYGLNIVGGAGDNYFHLAADITSAAVIPEPATLLLMVSGLFLLRKTKASR